MELTVDEIWKEIEDFPGYYVSDQGRMKMKKGKFSEASVCSNGYIKVSIFRDGKRHARNIHRLVAKTFIPNPKKKKVVNHINGDRTDNRVANLEWLTQIENSSSDKRKNPENINPGRKIIQYDLEMNKLTIWDSVAEAGREMGLNKSHLTQHCRRGEPYGDFYWKYYDEVETIDGEIWETLEYDGNSIEVSNFGRVKHKKGAITYGKNIEGYRGANIGKKTFRIHYLVCVAFKPIDDETGMIVNHIDNIRSNNHADNLEWVTHSGNTQHYYSLPKEKKKSKNCMVVNQYDLDGNCLTTFESITEASKELGIGSSSIGKAVRDANKTAGGYKWGLVEDPRFSLIEQVEEQDFYPDEKKTVVIQKIKQIDDKGVSVYKIRKYAREQKTDGGGFKWEFLDEEETQEEN